MGRNHRQFHYLYASVSIFLFMSCITHALLAFPLINPVALQHALTMLLIVWTSIVAILQSKAGALLIVSVLWHLAGYTEEETQQAGGRPGGRETEEGEQ